MRPVQGAVALPGHGAGRPRRVGARAALLGALAAVAVGGGTVVAIEAAAPARPAPAASRVESAQLGGVPLQLASCSNWAAARPAERANAVAALTAAVGGMTPAGPATTLTAAQADGLFARWCASPVAAHFLLYELYIRAAGFRSALPSSP